MGNCTKGGVSYEDKYLESQDVSFSRARQKLSQSELRSLMIIYHDLADRDPTSKLNLQNFLLFFHKNGFWGERLFKQFDADHSNYISQKQFIKGIVRIFKTTEDQKIKLLYHFFQKEGMQGITFNDFIVVLYNYPKTDLKQIFNDEEFVDTEIKKRLIQIKRGYNESTKLENGGQVTQYRIQGSDLDSDMPIPSAYGFKGVLQQLKKKRLNQPQTSLKLNLDGKSIQVKTSNIQHLVKKFAKKLFKQYKIEQAHGKLCYKDFHQWIQTHKNLYKNYYDGFHNEVWQSDQTVIPKYITAKNQKQSTGKMVIENNFQQVHLFFINSTIIVSKENDKCYPIFIVCLDGLSVKKIFDSQKGFGIQISHRDGIYKLKKIFMKNQELVTQWMELLKFFKGLSVQQQYDMGQKIGTGKFSIVYACKEKKTSQQYAIKVIQSSKLDLEARQLIAHETSIMSVLNHPLLVHFKQSIQTKTHLYIVTELVKGMDLYEYIKIHGPMPQIQAAKVIRQLILGVKHLHDIGIIHRDLKPQNIMLVSSNNLSQKKESVKIIDFGFSVYKNSLANLDPSQLLAGTPSFIAPEILKSELISELIDNFAVGAIIYFVLSGQVPFNGHTINEMFQKTLDGQYTYDSKPWRIISLQAKNLIDKLLLENTDLRISLQEALKHPWFIKTYQK